MTCNETMLRITAESIVPKILKDMKDGTPRSARNAIELIQTFTDSALKQELLLFAKKSPINPAVNIASCFKTWCMWSTRMF